MLEAREETLQAARVQLGRTVGELAEKNPAFAHIPTDRPLLGLVVTAEPFYTGSAFLLDHDTALLPAVGSLPDVPVASASAREIGWLVTHGDDVEGLLLDLMARRGDGVVSRRQVAKRGKAQNPILARAWETYPWPSRAREGDQRASRS